MDKERAAAAVKLLNRGQNSYDDWQDLLMHFIEYFKLEGQEMIDFAAKCGFTYWKVK